MKDNLEPEVWLKLEKTYSDSNFKNIWESLFTMERLFRRVAKSMAANFGFQYPQQYDDNVSGYIHRIKNLAKNAKEI